MAFEAVLRSTPRPDAYIDFTVADGVGIEKGTVLKLTDPRTASASDGAGDVLAGIAAREKIASDGRTQLSVIREGIFDMYCSGAVPIGTPVMSAGVSNEINCATTGISGAAILGYALETGADDEVIQVYVNVGSGGVK